MNDGDTQRGELKRQLTSLERKIQLAKGKEEHYQKDVKEFEEKLQRLSDQQDEGTTECSECIVYHCIPGNVLTWWSSKNNKSANFQPPYPNHMATQVYFDYVLYQHFKKNICILPRECNISLFQGMNFVSLMRP